MAESERQGDGVKYSGTQGTLVGAVPRRGAEAAESAESDESGGAEDERSNSFDRCRHDRPSIDAALLELSFPAVPCQKQAQWFTDCDFTRLAYENNPQWTRWYAWVREPGSAATNDEVLIV